MILTPQSITVVPRSARLTRSGEAKEAEAAADIREGRISVFDSAQDLLADLAMGPRR